MLAEPFALKRVTDDNGELGLARLRIHVIARDAENRPLTLLILAFRNQRHLPRIIEMTQADHAVARQCLDHAEETSADRLLRQRSMMGLDKRLVLRTYGPDDDFLAVGELPGGRVLIRVWLNRQLWLRLIRRRQNNSRIEGEQAIRTGQERIDVDLPNIEKVAQQVTEADEQHLQLVKRNRRLPPDALQGRKDSRPLHE